MTIGVITVIDEEKDAVKKILNLTADKVTLEKYGKQVYKGTIESQNGTKNVVMTQCLSQGQQAVINALNFLLARHKLDFICLVGIAGGLNKHINYTDVVLAEEVVCYDLAKEQNGKTIRRGTAAKLPSNVLSLYQAVKDSIKDRKVKAANGSVEDTLNVLSGAIASGSVVIDDSKSKIKSWTEQFNDKILACEMEGWGFVTGASDNVKKESLKKGYCIIRGISDMADGNKEKLDATKYRIPAAENAAIVLKEIVRIL